MRQKATPLITGQPGPSGGGDSSGSASGTGHQPAKTESEPVFVHSVALSISCLLGHWVATHLLTRVHLVSQADVLLGGMWAVIATVVVVHQLSYGASLAAADSRIAATFVGFARCLVYVLLFSFTRWA
jgi:hypothetical protein